MHDIVGLLPSLNTEIHTIYSPLDLVRSRLSVATAGIGAGGTAAIQAGSHITIWGMTKKVFLEEGGIRGLYRLVQI